MVRAVCAALLLSVAATASADPPAAGAGEKLLLGFEHDEIAAAMAKAKTKGMSVWPDGDEFTFLAQRLKGGGYHWGYCPPRISPLAATQGKFAFKAAVPIADTADAAPRRPWADRTWALFYTFTGEPRQVFDLFFPRDWSGWPLLRIDLRVERTETKADTAVVIDFGDEDLDPPPGCSYTVAPGRWVTLEVDLERAARQRGLRPDRMCYLMVRLGPIQKAKKVRYQREQELATFFIDNVRLSARDAKADLPVLRDERSLEFTPRPYAVEYDLTTDARGKVQYRGWKEAESKMPEAARPKPEPGPKTLGPPSVIDLTAFGPQIDCRHLESLAVGAQVAAYDAARILLPFHCAIAKRWFYAHDAKITLALGTLDGGATWKGADGAALPTMLMASHHADGSAVALGGDLIAFADWGCQNPGHNYPTDKGFCRRTVFTGDGWWLSPFYFIDAHGHHCIGQQTGTRTAAGRLWTLWEHPGRARNELCARFSDDGGATWQSWLDPGRAPVLPDLVYCNSVSIVPFGDHVAAVVRSRMNGRMSVFDGKGWSAPAPACDAFRQQAVSVDGREIYVAGNGGVWGFDGKEWKHELAVGDHAKRGPMPRLAVCGRTVLCFDRDPTSTKLLCWRRIDGKWRGPQTVAEEKTAVTDFATQEYAPADFAPLAYVCAEEKEVIDKLLADGANPRHVRRFKPWIKLLKVPAAPPAE